MEKNRVIFETILSSKYDEPYLVNNHRRYNLLLLATHVVQQDNATDADVLHWLVLF